MIRFEKEEVATAQSMEEVQKVQKKPQEMSFLELKNFIGEERSREENGEVRINSVAKNRLSLCQSGFRPCRSFSGYRFSSFGQSFRNRIECSYSFCLLRYFSLGSTLAEGEGLSPFGAWMANIMGFATGGGLLWWKRKKLKETFYGLG